MTYTTFQYGLGDRLATGIDLYTGPDVAYWGALIRYAYLTSALYLNGAISSNGNPFWCTNTWWIVNKGAAYTFSNYEYLGYTVDLGKSYAITPMIGTIHSWKFDKDVDMAAGLYFTAGNWNLYVWGNDLLNDHPRLVVGLDFVY